MKSEQTPDLHTLFANGVKARSIASINSIKLVRIEQSRCVQFVLIYFYLHSSNGSLVHHHQYMSNVHFRKHSRPFH